jgi:mRNA interferase YafQ
VKVNFTKRFLKDVDLCKARGWDTARFTQAYHLLVAGQSLPESFCDHPLRGNYAGHREFHFAPDHLVIYYFHPEPKAASKARSLMVSSKEITFVRMGSHSDLF